MDLYRLFKNFIIPFLGWLVFIHSAKAMQCHQIASQETQAPKQFFKQLDKVLTEALSDTKKYDIPLSREEKTQLFIWMNKQWQKEKQKTLEEGEELLAENSLFRINNKDYKIISFLGAGIEAQVYLVERESKYFALKYFYESEDLVYNHKNFSKAMNRHNKIVIHEKSDLAYIQEMVFGLSLKILRQPAVYRDFYDENSTLLKKIQDSLESHWKHHDWNSVLSLKGQLYLIDPH